MRVILFGATGMVGQGVLRECLLDPAVDSVLSVVRRAASPTHPRLRELVHTDFLAYQDVRLELLNLDACFFCLGVTSAGISEADYRVVTYQYAIAAARVPAELNPRMTFVFISGQGADNTGRSRVM